MPTAINLKRILHRKNWEVCTPSMGPSNLTSGTGNGSFVTSDKFNITPKASAYYVNNASAIYRYDAEQDGWLQIPNSGAAGSFGTGAAGEYRGLGAMGGVFTQTATGGSSATINTNRQIVRDLSGCRVRVVAGLGVGFDGTVLSNTIGSNSVIKTSGSTTFDSTTQFQVYSGSLWFLNTGTTAIGFSVYDVATNTWTARSVTGLPTSWGTCGQLVSTIGSVASFATGTSSGTNTTTTLNHTGKTWLSNQWANYQVRITGGTGVGQIRVISSNTATALTVSSAWTTTPDATSTYSIEGNDDVFYLLGNNAVTLYRFTVSSNTWATLAPAAARGAAAGGGATGNWIESVPSWTLNSGGDPSALTVGSTIYKQNGRYIFSFRGGGSSGLDIYDIAANTWISSVGYGNQNETFSSGSSNVDYNGNIYIQRDGTGRILRFEIESWSLQTFSAHAFPQGTVVEGSKMFIIPFIDGATVLPYLYTQCHSQAFLLRTMVF